MQLNSVQFPVVSTPYSKMNPQLPQPIKIPSMLHVNHLLNNAVIAVIFCFGIFHSSLFFFNDLSICPFFFCSTPAIKDHTEDQKFVAVSFDVAMHLN